MLTSKLCGHNEGTGLPLDNHRVQASPKRKLQNATAIQVEHLSSQDTIYTHISVSLDRERAAGSNGPALSDPDQDAHALRWVVLHWL